MIKPTIGRVVWYHPPFAPDSGSNETTQAAKQFLGARTHRIVREESDILPRAQQLCGHHGLNCDMDRIAASASTNDGSKSLKGVCGHASLI